MRIALTATPSAPFLSPRPTQRPAAIAAASVTRTSSRARLRSGESGAASRLSVMGAMVSVGRGRSGTYGRRSPSPTARPAGPARAPARPRPPGVTSASRSGSAATSRRTASPCGATLVTVPRQRWRADPDGSASDTVTTRGLNDMKRPSRAQDVEPDEPGHVVGAGLGRHLRGRRPPGRAGPSSSTQTWSASVNASRASWVTSSATPSYDARWRASSTRRPVATPTSRPPSGSSSRSSRGSRGQRPGDRDPLRLSARQLAAAAAPARSPMPNRSSHSRAAALRGVAVHAAAARAEGHVGQRSQVREEQLVLERQPRPTGRGRPGRRVDHDSPVDPTSPARRHQPGEGAQQRRLAGTVGADHRDHLTGARPSVARLQPAAGPRRRSRGVLTGG